MQSFAKYYLSAADGSLYLPSTGKKIYRRFSLLRVSVTEMDCHTVGWNFESNVDRIMKQNDWFMSSHSCCKSWFNWFFDEMLCGGFSPATVERSHVFALSLQQMEPEPSFTHNWHPSCCANSVSCAYWCIFRKHVPKSFIILRKIKLDLIYICPLLDVFFTFITSLSNHT